MDLKSMNDALDDVIARFLLVLPSEEVPTYERLYGHIQKAHWYYEDYYVDEDETNSIPSLSGKEFARLMFERCPLLANYKGEHSTFHQDFKKYMASIPVYGALLMNQDMTKLVLVCNYSGKSWMIPRGKMNEDESPIDCAIREVQEETGFNCRHLISKRTPYIEQKEDSKVARYYIVRGVSEKKTKF